MLRKIFSSKNWKGDSDEDFAANLVENGLGVPSVFLLEAVKPLNTVTSSAFTVLSPFGHLLFNPEKYDLIPDFFSDRGRIEEMISSIEKELTNHEA